VNKNRVLGPDGARNQKRLCWRGPVAICWTGQSPLSLYEAYVTPQELFPYSKVKGKYITVRKDQVLKAYWGIEVTSHIFYTSATDVQRATTPQRREANVNSGWNWSTVTILPFILNTLSFTVPAATVRAFRRLCRCFQFA
jgi:hypothetical protein